MMKKSVFLVSLLLAGCSLTPDYSRPSTASMSAFTQGQAGDVAISPVWWKNFGSSELDAIMETALVKNHDIRGSLARIEQSRASLKAVRGSLYPSLNATGGASQTQSDGDSSNSWRAGAGVSYEVDLFGRVSSSVAANAAQLESSKYSHQALKLVLMADVAQTYFDLLNSKERLRIADENLQIAESILEMIRKRFDAGLDSALEVSQQSSSVQSAKASRASLEANLRTTETALAILLGQAPTLNLTEAQSLTNLTVPEISAGVPSSLLERRPDIRQSEADLVAANANIGTARAALYPSVTLGLDWTVAASGFGDPTTTALALASSLAAPIFNGGRLEAGVEQATARQTELIESYRQTVLVSFKEVEDALATVKAAQIREAALAASQAEAQRSYDLAEARYKAGSTDFQTLLNTQAQLFQAKDSYLQTKNERLAAAVLLYKALGGGWSSTN